MPLPFIIGIGALMLLLASGDENNSAKKKKGNTVRGNRKLFTKNNLITVPQKPGVYIFYNRNQRIIFVGSAANLKEALEIRHSKKLIINSFSYKITQNAKEAHDLQNQIIGALKENRQLTNSRIRKG